MVASHSLLAVSTSLAHEVQRVGDDLGLPCVAVAADIGSPEPLRGEDGEPLAETLFRWVTPDLRYWQKRDFALKSTYCRAIRAIAEPFYVLDGRAATWRESPALDAVNAAGPVTSPGVGTALVAPVHLPRGLIGAVVWASADAGLDIRGVFARHAVNLHALAMKFIGAYNEAIHSEGEAPVCLTRREVQCLKWAAAGKTDGDIARIVDIAVPTVRFHMTNAWKKLHVVGRSQAIYRAATLGYLGERPDSAPGDVHPRS